MPLYHHLHFILEDLTVVSILKFSVSFCLLPWNLPCSLSRHNSSGKLKTLNPPIQLAFGKVEESMLLGYVGKGAGSSMALPLPQPLLHSLWEHLQKHRLEHDACLLCVQALLEDQTYSFFVDSPSNMSSTPAEVSLR